MVERTESLPGFGFRHFEFVEKVVWECRRGGGRVVESVYEIWSGCKVVWSLEPYLHVRGKRRTTRR